MTTTSRLPSSKNIGRFAVDLVAELGSTHVFTLTGGMAMYLNRAVAQHPSLTAVYCQHEQACVAAAEGYAKASNFRRAGFAIVTAGPGASNSITALISAYGDSTPLIVLSGQIKTADIDTYGTRTHGIQEIRSPELISPCVKEFVRLAVKDYREQLIKAFIRAFAGRPGPVFIEVPLDVQGFPIVYSAQDVKKAAALVRQEVQHLTRVFSEHDRLRQALEALLGARKPLLYIGNGVRIAGQEAAVRDFAEKHQIPMVFSWLSFDIVEGNHALHFGCPGGLSPIYANQVLGSADTIVFLGARLDLGTTAFQREAFGGQAERWLVDVDPAELAKFAGMPRTYTVETDLRALPGVLTNLDDAKSPASSDWLGAVTAMRAEYLPEERKRLSSDKFNVYGVASVLSGFSAGKVFVSASSGYAEETFTRFFVPGPGCRFFNGAALGAMGMGLPNALGASFSTDLPVMCLEADGGLMLNIQEMATLSQYGPPGFVLYVLNNGGYESIRSSQTRHFGEIYGADKTSGLFIPDFRDLAQAFRLEYICIECLEDLASFVANRDPKAAPVVVDLRVQESEYRGPSVKTVIDTQGRPSTTSLAEISW